MAMERSEIRYILAAALDRLNRDQEDTANWGDVRRAVKDARERKVKESLTSIVGSYNLTDLSTALSIAEDESRLALVAAEEKMRAVLAAIPATPVTIPAAPTKSPAPKKRK